MTPRPAEHETRRKIERELAAQRRKSRITAVDFETEIRARAERELEGLRAELDPVSFARIRADLHKAVGMLIAQMRGRRRGDGSLPALVEPPRGPKPLAGGAAARLEFDD